MSQPGQYQVSKDGAYDRKPSTFRDAVKAGSRFEPEAGRYHLHVALACPWACGTLSMLYLKGLEDVVSHSIVHPTWQRTEPGKKGDEHCGWVYRSPGDPPLQSVDGHGSFVCDGALKPDTVSGCSSIRELYEMAGAAPGTTYSTPVLWDSKLKTIVNNESTEILAMFNSAFGELATKADVDLYPAELEEELTALNDSTVYPSINNGVYRSGFARTQAAYEEAIDALFRALDEMEERLASRRFLTGDKFTWLDLRFFHTLVRFDPVYITYFKTNAKRIADYPNLLGFTRDVYSDAAIARTINISHIKTHYFTSHPHLNTFAIIPTHNGPELTRPSGRAAVRDMVTGLGLSPHALAVLRDHGSQRWEIEFGGFLTNHLWHGVVALAALGASGKLVDDFVAEYTQKLQPTAPAATDQSPAVESALNLGCRQNFRGGLGCTRRRCFHIY